MKKLTQEERIEKINRLHQEGKELLRLHYDRVLEVIQLLEEQKGDMSRSKFKQWMESNVSSFRFSDRDIGRYLKVMENPSLKDAIVNDSAYLMLCEMYRLQQEGVLSQEVIDKELANIRREQSGEEYQE